MSYCFWLQFFPIQHWIEPPDLYGNYIYVTNTRGVRSTDSQYVVFFGSLISSQLDYTTSQLRLGTLKPSASKSGFAAAGIFSAQFSVLSVFPGSNLAL